MQRRRRHAQSRTDPRSALDCDGSDWETKTRNMPKCGRVTNHMGLWRMVPETSWTSHTPVWRLHDSGHVTTGRATDADDHGRVNLHVLAEGGIRPSAKPFANSPTWLGEASRTMDRDVSDTPPLIFMMPSENLLHR